MTDAGRARQISRRSHKPEDPVRPRGPLPLLLALLLLSACRHDKGDKPRPPAAYSPPSFHVPHLVRPPIDVRYVPSAAAFERRLNDVAGRWLDYWRTQTAGKYRPASIPRGDVGAEIIVEKTCSNSAEMPGRGAYGVLVSGWSCTRDEQRPAQWIEDAVCHRASHVFDGTSGGNAAHARIAQVAGC